ncbi:LLM class flavin-dependent oxidoreductase [Streptomyces acidiscabies]|uniref:LLM class flavin-dependent oxidoreductase n=1 Tax=Streptomyces acidiscabies TaxID=42234 RepID=A0AAP6BFW8_9ACTN|nr:LLM class flavin-dependent oxidoreductase [Streptomyces acidiscabies]MBP5936557.1 LLM class flavin-dependent oxidoreductase [Streptomyces sp. LBUM 1476]MBZ3915451.1 LLM class flavin-dependent oxidoreductase [Streptomyces acidiscabies]MDX2964001.1 LLM class flavin-dependent oxidoreductase [Streptomyces acidiscabies]MDX3022445.1 LLM class flavin-dependent oxidoreductase [Streptomyces acidiscabies]MDX3794447.1 LLM class flavin-dependent oxidoreductase [Streptomyces acidiscabies]
MPVSVLRFNLAAPDATPAELAARYQAALRMAAYADDHGVTTVQTEEHHGAENNWLPSPFTFAGAVLGATKRLAVTVSAAIGPLHDPLRLAEDIAVLDLLSAGRLMTVTGIGYRREEYDRAGVPWERRGRLQDELLETLLQAWTGEPFTYRGRRVRVTPRPATSPHPLLLVGGSSQASARRAARLGLPFFPSAHLPALETYYKARLNEYGTEGWVLMPPAETPLLHISETPDKTWQTHGHHFLHEARTYAAWQSTDIHSVVRSAATTIDELREEGVYRILTPTECLTQNLDNLVLHPLAGGMPIEEAWRSLRLFTEQVLPKAGA